MPLPGVAALCGAKTADGSACENPGMENGRCYLHGGPTPTGIGSVHFRHGRYSKVLGQGDLLERYHAGVNDQELSSLHDEMALLDGRIAAVVEGLEHGESQMLWKALGGAVAAVRALTKRCEEEPDDETREDLVKDRERAVEALLFLVDQGVSDSASWAELIGLFDVRRTLAQAEVKRHVALKQSVPVAQVLTLQVALAEVLNQHVPEPERRRALSADLGPIFSRLIGGSGPG